MKKFTTTIIIITLAILSTFGQSYSGGLGTSNDPYWISDKTDLKYISENSGEWAKFFIQTADITFVDADFQSGGAFYNGGEGFIPIGNNTTEFTGTYDGDGKSISNLYILQSSGNIGLFGSTNDATLSDINMVDADITASLSTNYNVGGIAGYIGGTTSISGCTASGDFYGCQYIGALVGYSESTSSITNCTTSGTITLNPTANYTGYCGGLVGTSKGSITNSSSSVTLGGNKGYSTGGLVGYCYSTIEDCFATGEVSGRYEIGGIVGSLDGGSINRCYATGNIVSDAANNPFYLGGLVGIVRSNSGAASISNSYSLGDVTRSTGTYVGFGGFCGKSDQTSGTITIENCYSIGNVYYTNASDPTDKGFCGVQGSTTTFSDNFFDSQASNQTTGTGATTRTTTQMKQATNFLDAGWDFTLTGEQWAMNQDVNNGYPFIRMQGETPGQIWLASAKSTDWSTAGNWSEGNTPESTNNVIIPDVASNPTISNNSSSPATCNKLTIETDASLTIDATGQLTVSGDLENNGSLDIISTSSGTGSLLHQTSDVEATVQQYIAKDNKWHFLSVPFSQTTMPEICDGNYAPLAANFTSTTGATYDFYYLNESTAEDYWINLKNDVWEVNTTGYGATPRFVSGKGYLVAYNTNFAGEATKTITANLNSGTTSIPLTATNLGYNLVGNPYPSSIDWKAEDGWTRTNIEAYEGYNMWIWNDALGQFGAYNSEGESSGTNGVTRYIAPGQAFYVKASTLGNLGMTNDVRVHSTQPWLKATNEIVDFKLTVTGEPTPYQDEIKIEFGHSDDLGGAEKMYSMYAEAPALSTAKYGKQYSIDFREEATYPVIPVSFQSGVDGTYTFTANFNQNSESIILEDLKLDLKVDITTNPIYSFLSSTSDNPNRFLLHFSPVGINETADSNNEIQVYSHSNTITIINNYNLAGMVNIANIMGQEVASFNLNGDNTQRETINVPGGVYIVYTEADNGNVYSEKIIVN